MSESKEQQAVVRWFRHQYSDKIIFAIPNGSWVAGEGKWKFALINKYKAEGMTPGVSDLFIAVPTFDGDGNIRHCGLFLEMKAEGKTLTSLSKQQKQFIENMRLAGYSAGVAAGFEQAKQIIENYLT